MNVNFGLFPPLPEPTRQAQGQGRPQARPLGPRPRRSRPLAQGRPAGRRLATRPGRRSQAHSQRPGAAGGYLRKPPVRRHRSPTVASDADAGAPAPPAGRPERRRAAARAARLAAAASRPLASPQMRAHDRGKRRRPAQLEQVMDAPRRPRASSACGTWTRSRARMERHGAHQADQRPGSAEVACRRAPRCSLSRIRRAICAASASSAAAGRLGIGGAGPARSAGGVVVHVRFARIDQPLEQLARQAVARRRPRPAAAPPDGGARSPA